MSTHQSTAAMLLCPWDLASRPLWADGMDSAGKKSDGPIDAWVMRPEDRTRPSATRAIEARLRNTASSEFCAL